MGGFGVLSEFNNEPVSVRGCKVGMLRGGAGEPLLYLHGGGGGGVVLPFMTALAKNFEVLAPEHPGFGVTDEPDWLDNIHDVAFFYLDFLDALDLTGVHLVGMSLGGWIAAEIAVRSTARIKTLTLAGAAGIHAPNLATGDLFTWSPEETMRQGFHDQTLAEKAIAAFPENVEGDDTFLKNRSTLARLAWEPRMHDPHLYKWLHRIDVPTRVIWADDDKFLSAGYAEAWTKLIPGARSTIIAGCGHFMHIEKPAEFAAAVEDHIKGAAK